MRQLVHLLLPCLLLLATAVRAEGPVKPLPADVRVIIDISGSMKKTDPDNLRKPAVDLIVRLLPDNSKAGLWTFGQSVNMLVPHRVVDPQWRTDAAQKATTINSIAMFTNIGAALENATEDHATPEQEYRRNIILLTDGVVDISKEAVANLNERKRVLTELLPRLKEAGYHIHTIALSADADQELMKKLSIATDGIFEVADTADELMNTFLRIFDQAVPAERVPLDENGFLVDASIQEFTALIFRRAEVPATIIVAPDGKEYSGTDPKNNVNWYRTGKYDLITVQQPQVGRWKVKTDMAPGSRVTVVSNLQLVVAPLKSNIKSNQALDLAYSFLENGQTITNNDFLGLLTGKALISNPNAHEVAEVDLHSAPPADGIFHHSLKGFGKEGEYDVHIVIDGKTFKREFIHHLNVTDSAFKLEKRLDETAGKKTWVYKLSADLEAVDVDNTKVTALIQKTKTENMAQQLNTIGKDHWEFSFTPSQPGRYDITMQVEGKHIDGSPLTETIKVDQVYFPDEATVLAAAQPKSQAASSSAASQAAVAPEPEPKAEQEEESDNLFLYIGIGIGNLLVLVLGYLVYRLIAGKGSKDELAEIEKTLATDAAGLKKAPAKTAIDVSDDQMSQIPIDDANSDGSKMSGSTDTEMNMADDLMADNLFPLDNMDDSDNDKK
ncbi:MAG TPA: VWA domain-containing protein [Cellvibrio sp.]|nr:VWA domain-containing protein [Cellvibrio sp.]